MSRPTKTIATLALLIAAGLAGCGSENSTPADATADAATSPAPAPAPAAPATAVDDNNPATAAQGGWQPNPLEGLQCQLDIVSGQPATAQVSVRREAGVSLEGWVFENGQPQVEKLALVLVKGSEAYVARAKGGVARPDVAQAFNIPELGNSGFNTMTDLSNVPAGKYALWVANGPASSDKACNLKVEIDLQG